MLRATELAIAKPQDLWEACRTVEWDRPTAGLCKGFTQTNLAILPREDAFDFLRFCQRNPKPCPIIEVTDPGDPEPKLTAAGADLRTALPRYRVYRRGQLVEERTDIRALWRDDLVAFLLGCSFTFEHTLLDAGVPVRHVELGVNAPVFSTNIRCTSAGQFGGPLVVSMRPIPAHQVPLAVTIAERRPSVHGAPVHVGVPEALGIEDINQPDWGDAVTINSDELPVFWACGVTPQAVAIEAAPELMITHAPGHMFVTQLTDEQVGG
jgi:uncharacterized protein YcsI (UPF0317 family)